MLVKILPCRNFVAGGKNCLQKNCVIKNKFIFFDKTVSCFGYVLHNSIVYQCVSILGGKNEDEQLVIYDVIRLVCLISEVKFQKSQVNILKGSVNVRLLFLLMIQSPQSALFKWCKYC